jgi:hypothetical protein
VTFSVTSGAGTPAGTVTVTVSGGGEICQGVLSDAGMGTCDITLTELGDRLLSASYAGEGNFAGSATAAGTPHTVNPPPAAPDGR